MCNSQRKRKKGAGQGVYGIACAPCKMGHKACDGARPCARCISFGNQACFPPPLSLLPSLALLLVSTLCFLSLFFFLLML